MQRIRKFDSNIELDHVVDTLAKHTSFSRFKQHGYNAKEFTDLLGPLRRYLRKQVGRPWNKVYSEISKTLDNQTLTGRHILNHVSSEVAQSVWIEDKKVYVMAAMFGRRYPVRGLYVHPTSRLLCRVKK